MKNTLYIGKLLPELDVDSESDPDVIDNEAEREEWVDLKRRVAEASRKPPALQRICKVNIREFSMMYV